MGGNVTFPAVVIPPETKGMMIGTLNSGVIGQGRMVEQFERERLADPHDRRLEGECRFYHCVDLGLCEIGRKEWRQQGVVAFEPGH